MTLPQSTKYQFVKIDFHNQKLSKGAVNGAAH